MAAERSQWKSCCARSLGNCPDDKYSESDGGAKPGRNPTEQSDLAISRVLVGCERTDTAHTPRPEATGSVCSDWRPGWFYRKTQKMSIQHESYKLQYFDVPGRAEHIRYIFAYAGVDFDDVRVSKDQWPELKKKTPFGKLPVLVIDGKDVPQSNAIARYLARQFGLTGKTEWDALQCDVLVDTLGDLQESVTKVMKEPDPIKREELRARVTKEELPFYLSKFEKIVKDNGGYSVGSDVTWSDLVLAVLLDQFEGMYGRAALNIYPSLKGLKERIHDVPNVKAYLEKRPPRSPLPRQ